MLPFSSSHVFPSSAVVNPGWSGGLVTSCADVRLHSHTSQQQQQVHMVDKQDLFLGSSPTSYNKEGKQLAFLQGDRTTATLSNQNSHLPAASSMCLRNNSPFTESGGLRCKMFCDNSLTSSVHDSSCALSLLSSPQTHNPGNGLNQMVQPPHSSLMQPLGLSLHDSGMETVDPVLGHNGSDHCSSMYNMDSHGSQGNEAPQLFSFQWE